LQDSNQKTVASLDGDRAFFDGKTHLVDSQFLHNGGLYTVVFPSKAQPGSPAAATYPQGHGFGSIKVSANGQATLRGKLGDGSVFTASAPFSKGYRLPCYAQLYSKHGSIAGFLSLEEINAVSEFRGYDLNWFRPIQASAKYYPAGWPNGVMLDCLGSEYVVPPASTRSVFPNLTAVNLLTGNALLTFADGKLSGASNPLAKPLNINVANQVKNISDTTFTLRISSSTGGLSGSFTHSDGTHPAFKGVILQNDVPTTSGTLQAGGYGYFLSVPPKVVGGLGESGSVLLQAK
jgi:hypothetical protein